MTVPPNMPPPTGDPLPEVVETAAAPEPGGCPSCGAKLVEGQDFCLDCGAPLWRRPSTWRVPAAIVGAVLAFVFVSTAVAFVAISDDAPEDVTVAQNGPPVTQTDAAPPSLPATTTPPAATTPPASDPGKPPKVSTPPPSSSSGGSSSSGTPTPVTPPSSSSGGSSGGGSSGGSSSGGSSGGSSSGGSSGGSSSGGSTGSQSKPEATEVTLDGDPITAFNSTSTDDPNDLITDKRTTWSTGEFPGGPPEPGVGVVLKAANAVAADRLDVRVPSNDGGFTLEIYGSSSDPSGGDLGQRVGKKTNVQDKEKVSLSTDGKRYQYYSVLVTRFAAEKFQTTLSQLTLFA